MFVNSVYTSLFKVAHRMRYYLNCSEYCKLRAIAFSQTFKKKERFIGRLVFWNKLVIIILLNSLVCGVE